MVKKSPRDCRGARSRDLRGADRDPTDGTNAEEGREILANAGIPESKLRSEPTMLDAARAAVALANGSN